MSSRVSAPAERVTLTIPPRDELPPKLRTALARIDADKDGAVSFSELAAAVEHQNETERENARLRSMLAAGTVLYLITLAAFFALSWYASFLLKDAWVSGKSVMQTGDGNTIAVATRVSSSMSSYHDFLKLSKDELAKLEMVSVGLTHNSTVQLTVSDRLAEETMDPAVEGAKYGALTLYTCAGGKFYVSESQVTYTDPDGQETVLASSGSRRLIAASPLPGMGGWGMP